MEWFRGEWVKERAAWRQRQEEYRRKRRECLPLQELRAFNLSFLSPRTKRPQEELPSTANTPQGARRPQSATTPLTKTRMNAEQVEKVKRLAIRNKERRLGDMNKQGMFDPGVNEVRARCIEQAEFKSWCIRMSVNTRKKRVQLGWTRLCKRLFEKSRWSFLDDAHKMQGGDLLAAIIVNTQSTASGKKKLNSLANAQNRLIVEDYDHAERFSSLS
eukprot:746534-Hanusia_phi.AAC.1